MSHWSSSSVCPETHCFDVLLPTITRIETYHHLAESSGGYYGQVVMITKQSSIVKEFLPLYQAKLLISIYCVHLTGAPNAGFLLNKLKTLIRLSRVLAQRLLLSDPAWRNRPLTIRSIYCSFRPISNLKFAPKAIEKTVATQLNTVVMW